MSRSHHLVSVAEFRNALDAHSTRILLEANGIPAVVIGDAISEMGLEPISVHVHRENVELAHRVIQEVPAAADVLIPEWICKCGEQVVQDNLTCVKRGYSEMQEVPRQMMTCEGNGQEK